MKEIDISAFDEEVEESKEIDLSAFDETPEEDIVNASGAALGAGVGALAGKAVQTGIEKGLDSNLATKVKKLPMKALEGMGELDKSQLTKIMANASEYSDTPDMTKIASEFGEEAKQMQEDVFSLKRQASDVVEAEALSIPKDKLVKKIEELKELRKFTSIEGNELPVKDIQEFIDEQKKFLEGIETPKGKELQAYLDELSDKADYNKLAGTESTKNKAAKSLRRGVRSELATLSSKYDELMVEASKKINDRQSLSKLISLKGNPKDFKKPLEVTNATVNKITNILTNPKYENELASLRELVEKNPNGLEDLLNKAELSAIKEIVEKKTGISNIKLGDILKGTIASSVLGPVGPVVGPAIALKSGYGTKAQEMLSLASQSKLAKGLGKGAKAIGKWGLKSLPVVGAVAGATSGYAQAKEEGYGEAAAMAHGAFEAVNPTPMSPLDIKNIHNKLGTQEEFRRAALRRQGSKNKIEEVTKELENQENITGIVQDFKSMNNPSANEYASQLERLDNSARDSADYLRRAGLLASEPAFRELMRRRNKAKEEVEE